MGEKKRSTSRDDELLLKFLSRKVELRLRFHAVLKRREQQGQFHGLMQQLKLQHGHFCTYFRMSVAHFEFELAEMGPDLRRQRNHFRDD